MLHSLLLLAAGQVPFDYFGHQGYQISTNYPNTDLYFPLSCYVVSPDDSYDTAACCPDLDSGNYEFENDDGLTATCVDSQGNQAYRPLQCCHIYLSAMTSTYINYFDPTCTSFAGPTGQMIEEGQLLLQHRLCVINPSPQNTGDTCQVEGEWTNAQKYVCNGCDGAYEFLSGGQSRYYQNMQYPCLNNATGTPINWFDYDPAGGTSPSPQAPPPPPPPGTAAPPGAAEPPLSPPGAAAPPTPQPGAAAPPASPGAPGACDGLTLVDGEGELCTIALVYMGLACVALLGALYTCCSRDGRTPVADVAEEVEKTIEKTIEKTVEGVRYVVKEVEKDAEKVVHPRHADVAARSVRAGPGCAVAQGQRVSRSLGGMGGERA